LADFIGLGIGILSVVLAVVGIKVAVSEESKRSVADVIDSIEPGPTWKSQIPTRLALALGFAITAYFVGEGIDAWDAYQLARHRELSGVIVYTNREEAKVDDKLAAYNLWKIDLDRSGRRQLTFSRDDQYASISVSGDVLVESVGADGRRQVHLLDEAGNRESLELYGSPKESFAPAWSPDGRQFAFIGRMEDGLPQLSSGGKLGALRHAGMDEGYGYYVGLYDWSTDESWPVWTGDARLGSPTWSRDNRTIAFERKQKGMPSEVVLLDTETQDVQDTYTEWDEHSSSKYPAFTADGRSLAITYVDKDAEYSVYVGPVNGLTDRPYSSGDYLAEHEQDVACATYSPDGQSVAYLSIRDDEWNLFVQDLSDHKVRRITSAPTGRVSWAPNSRSLLYPVMKNRNWEIERYWLGDSSRDTLTNDGVEYYRPDVSQEGTIVCQQSRYVLEDDDWSEGLALVDGAGPREIAMPADGPRTAHCPSWDAVSGRVVFNGAASGDQDDIWTIDALLADSCARWTDGRGDYILPDWVGASRDVVAVDASEGGRLVRVDTTSATRKPALLFGGSSRDTEPAVSPDGQKVAFISNRAGLNDDDRHELGQLYVARMGTNPGKPVLESEDTSYSEPCWSPDGRALAVVATTWESDGNERSEIHVIVIDESTFLARFRVVDSYVLCEGRSPAWSARPLIVPRAQGDTSSL